MKILVIEDNPTIASLLQKELSEAGHTVDACATGTDGERVAGTGVFDTIVLDVGLPDQSGIDVCQNLRHAGVTTPVLMLTVLSSACDKVKGLTVGADDYLSKPFDFDELKARLAALHRRAKLAVGNSKLQYADLELDLSSRTATRSGRTINLTKREFDLLALFLRNPTRVLNRDAIGSAVWNQQFDPQSNVVDVYVCMLRRKLNNGCSRSLIRTVVGVGYALDGLVPEPATN